MHRKRRPISNKQAGKARNSITGTDAWKVKAIDTDEKLHNKESHLSRLQATGNWNVKEHSQVSRVDAEKSKATPFNKTQPNYVQDVNISPPTFLVPHFTTANAPQNEGTRGELTGVDSTPVSNYNAKMRNSGNKKPSAFQRAKEDFKTKIKQKATQEVRRRDAAAEKKKQREQNIARRKANFKVFSRKTKKGQPIMADRMKLLLEKIQGSM